ncbi:spore coat protein YeeK-like [Daphnia carinata]|uniref:spore coat protein YeeK-like n=1 Tax=Daphnia carinata TaxID=120202 RepID=UPI00257958EB|nr:spore coat protein YeeK-like [Daphnia carinata]
MFNHKLILVCFMAVHCVLSIPVEYQMGPGYEVVSAEAEGEDQVVEDLMTAEHHGGYGDYYYPNYGHGHYYGHGGYGGYGGYYGGYGGYEGHGHGHHHHHHHHGGYDD